MKISAFNHCVSVISVVKDEKIYSMTCAWGVQLDYDKVGFLMGSQSTTAEQISPKMIVSVNVLSKGQVDIAMKLGDNHSSQTDKMALVDYTLNDGNVSFKDSKSVMKCEVIEVLHLKEMEADSFVTLKVLEYNENDNVDYLLMSDLR